MKIKTDKEFRTYQAEMEAITVKGTDLGDMELLSEEEKERYIVLSQAISEWEAAYHPLPGRVSTLIPYSGRFYIRQYLSRHFLS